MSISITVDTVNMQPHPRTVTRPLRRGRTKLLTVTGLRGDKLAHDSISVRFATAEGWRLLLQEGKSYRVP